MTLHHGHAEEVLTERGRAAGLRVDGQHIEADLVLDASGRSGRLGRGLRAPEVGADCGLAYVSRQYVLRPGAETVTVPEQAEQSSATTTAKSPCQAR